MPEGGILTISTELHKDSQTAVDRFVTLTVTDTGVGIPRDMVDRVFEPFFTTKEPGQGTGLGLSIIYGFVEESGGSVTLDSEVGRGTKIDLKLPQQAGEIVVPPMSVSANHVPLSAREGETVLVVEDDEGVRQIAVGAHLGDLGYTVMEAPDGRAALALLDGAPEISLVFSDLVMPGMNGRELAEELANRSIGVKVLLTSAYTERLTSVSAPGAVIGFLQKPYTEDDLALAVRRAIDAR